MGTLDCVFDVATSGSRNDRQQIIPLAVGASKIEQDVVLRGNCPHCRLLSHACAVWPSVPSTARSKLSLMWRSGSRRGIKSCTMELLKQNATLWKRGV